MKTFMALLTGAMALLVSGCASFDIMAFDAENLDPPPKYLMRRPAVCPPPPKDDKVKMTQSAIDHLAKITAACAKNKRGVRGWQRRERAISKS